MRLIGTLPSESDAVRFGDYLLTLGMPSRAEPDARGEAWQVWIERDDHLDQGVAQLRAFIANPNDPKYDAAASDARRVRREQATQAERRRRNFRDVRTSVFGTAARSHATPVSFGLIALCILVALATKVGMGDAPTRVGELFLFQPIDAAVRRYVRVAGTDLHPIVYVAKHHLATMFSAIAHGQVWRLFTPALLHFGIIHLVFNLSWLSSLGRAIETRIGPLRFLALVLLSAVFSNCTEALWTVYGIGQRGGWAPFGGMSGVVYALFGYAWLKGRLRPYEGLGVPQQTVGLMVGWLLVCMSGVVGNVANAAHVGGLAIGALIGAWPTLVRRIKAR